MEAALRTTSGMLKLIVMIAITKKSMVKESM